jgi:hypothetical protein
MACVFNKCAVAELGVFLDVCDRDFFRVSMLILKRKVILRNLLRLVERSVFLNQVKIGIDKRVQHFILTVVAQ